MGAVRHLLCSRPGAAWTEAVRPWLETVADAWQAERPSAVLVPDSFAAAALKRKIARAGLPLVGIDIYTPGRLRHTLCAGQTDTPPVAVREELALLLKLTAQSLPDNSLSRSVLTDPSSFLRDLDMLDAAGWNGRAFRYPPAVELAMAFQEKLDAAGLRTARQADRDAAHAGTIFARLLVTGFGPAHAEHVFLLQALAPVAEEATYVFAQPISDTPVDFAWTESWEHWLGPAEDVAEDIPEVAETPPFLLAPDPGTEAAAILRQIQHWLEADAGACIAVAVPHRHLPVLRELSLKLDQARLPHHDVGGHVAARQPGFLLLEAWAVMQETQRLQACVDFIACLRGHRQMSGGQAETLLRHLKHLFQDVMTDDLAVIAAAARQPEVRAFFKEWPSLPARAPLADFVEASRPVLERFAWPERLDFLSDRVAVLAPRLPEPLERAAFLGWLVAMVDIPGRSRSESGRHALSRVSLVTVTEALAADWTHIVFAGLNGKQWQPSRGNTGLLDEALCHALNQRAGYASDGAKPVAGRTRLLTPADQTALLEAAFHHLVGSSGAAIALSASRAEAPGATAHSPVNDLFLKAFLEAHHALPDESVCHDLEAQTLAWLGEAEAGAGFSGSAVFSGVHQNRRNPNLPFDGAFFGFDQPPPGGLDLSFSQWENVLKSPGSTWIKQVIRAEPAWEPDGEDSLAQALGLFIHDWLNPVRAEGDWVPLPTESVWRELIMQRADARKGRTAAAYQAAGRRLPDWWEDQHALAAGKALAMAQAAAAAPAGQVSGEYALPEGELELIPGRLALNVRGRIDLLIHEGNDPEPSAGPVMLVDYKTGNRKGLTGKTFADGDGLQLGLYALALRKLGYNPVSLCLLTAGSPLKAQLSVEEVEQAGPWELLAQLQRTGTVGHRGAFRDRFSYAGDFPQAILIIPANILAGKWQRTHPQKEENTT